MSSSSLQEHPQSDRLGYLLKRAQHALRTQMDEALSPLGITAPQYNVLSAVELQPGISNAALARAAFVTAQSMHGLVANLERIELLQRRPDPSHGRIRRGELTTKGRDHLKQAHALVKAVEVKMTSELGGDEEILLKSLLIRCVQGLEPEGSES